MERARVAALNRGTANLEAAASPKPTEAEMRKRRRTAEDVGKAAEKRLKSVREEAAKVQKAKKERGDKRHRPKEKKETRKEKIKRRKLERKEK